MKQLLLSIVAFCFAAHAWCQEPFCCVTEGAELGYVTTDAKGNETSTSLTRLQSVKGADGDYEIVQTITLYVNGKQMLQPMEIKSAVKGGNASLALGGGAAIDVSSDVPLIPAQLEVGSELNCGEMKVNMGGIKATQTITEHKVVGQEELTTPAGTYDCYIVEQKYTSKLGFIKAKGSQKIWYARGIGNVKTEMYDKRGKLSSKQILTSYEVK